MNPQRDVMTRLEAARPAHLDPAPDPQRRQHDLARALGEPMQPVRGLWITGQRITGHRISSRPARITVGLSAAAAVAAIGVVAVGGPGSSGGTGDSAGTPSTSSAQAGTTAISTGTGTDGGQGDPATLSASQILLLAADQVRSAPANGKYWRTTTDLLGLELAGPASDPYVVRSGNRDQDWVARSSSIKSLGASRGLGLKPATAADRAAWRRDGSPSTFQVHGNWADGKNHAKRAARKEAPDSVAAIPGAPTAWTVDRLNPASEVFFVGHELSMSAVRSLPSDPAALRTFLLTDYQRNVDAGAKYARPVPTQDEYLFSTASDLLTLPVSAQARASAYQIMAGLSGVSSLGTVTDLAGRTGNAVAVQGSDDNGVYQNRLVIDPTTGLLLAQETRYLKPKSDLAWLRASDVYSASVVRNIGWTDDRPPAETTYVPSGKGVG